MLEVHHMLHSKWYALKQYITSCIWTSWYFL